MGGRRNVLLGENMMVQEQFQEDLKSPHLFPKIASCEELQTCSPPQSVYKENVSTFRLL